MGCNVGDDEQQNQENDYCYAQLGGRGGELRQRIVWHEGYCSAARGSCQLREDWSEQSIHDRLVGERWPLTVGPKGHLLPLLRGGEGVSRLARCSAAANAIDTRTAEFKRRSCAAHAPRCLALWRRFLLRWMASMKVRSMVSTIRSIVALSCTAATAAAPTRAASAGFNSACRTAATSA